MSLWIRLQVWLTARKLSSLSPEQLLSAMTNPENGFDLKDSDRLVQLAFGNYPDGETRESIIRRISESFVHAEQEKRRARRLSE